MKISNLLIAGCMAIGLSSCFGDESNTVTQDFTPYCFEIVTDMSTGNTTYCKDATFKISTDQQKGQMTISIEQLKVAEGRYISFSVADQRYSWTEDGGAKISIPFYTSVLNGISHTITDFRFTLWSRYLGAQSFPMIQSSFIIDDTYDVTVVYNPAYYWGTTTVVDENGNTFTNSDATSFYGIQFDTTKQVAKVGIFGAKFNSGMPAQNMMFNDIAYSINHSGYNLSKAELIPTISDTPYPAYTVTDFTLTGTYGGRQNVSFVVTIDTERLKGKYYVNASLNIMPSASQN